MNRTYHANTKNSFEEIMSNYNIKDLRELSNAIEYANYFTELMERYNFKDNEMLESALEEHKKSKSDNRIKTGILFLLKDVCNDIKDRFTGLSRILEDVLKNDKDFSFDKTNQK